MIVVNFNPPLERKDFELVLPKVQEMFPDWEWCGNTGTPKFRGREQILAGALKDQNVSGYGKPIYTDKIGSLIHYGRFKHYGEPDCLGYSGGWSQADTDSYIKQGHDVEVINGWDIINHTPLDMDNAFNLTETIKKILKESEEEFDWSLEEISPAQEFLYQKFMECKLEKIGSENWINWTRYVDKTGKILFLDNINRGSKESILYFDRGEIYLKLKEFGLNLEEMNELCIDMLYETHKREVLTAVPSNYYLLVQLYETHKREVKPS